MGGGPLAHHFVHMLQAVRLRLRKCMSTASCPGAAHRMCISLLMCHVLCVTPCAQTKELGCLSRPCLLTAHEAVLPMLAC